ncbi:MAG: hypothetical protein Q8L29_04050 [archaeon]|nr:hypothetical protein [archaeon]
MGNIILVGSVHNDLKGPERLERVLNYYKPSIVGLEQTPQGATRGWQVHLDLQKKLETIPFQKLYTPEQIARLKLMFNSSYFEEWVPKVYKNGSPDIRLYCLDKELDEGVGNSMSAAEQTWLRQQLASGKTMADLLTPMDMDIKDFIDRGSVEEYQRDVDSRYDRVASNDFISRYGSELFRICVLERDERIAAQIRNIHIANPEKVFLVTLGNSHIFGDYSRNTYDLVSDLSPTRMKLKEADKL